MSDSKCSISVVIPVTSREADVVELIREYGSSLGRAGYTYEFVFVLDGVTGSVERALREQAVDAPVRVVRLQGGGLGESIALSAGVDRAAGELILNVPQYLQSEPEDVVKVIQALESGADFVATWRQPRIDPWLNRLQSQAFNWMLRVLMGIQFHDLNSSVRGMRRHVLEEVNVYGELYRFLPVLAMRRGFRTVEVKVRHRQEKGRQGFYGIGVYVRRLLDILAITFLTRFTQRPLRFFGMLGLASIAVGLAVALPPLIDKAEGDTAQRPVLVLGAILVAFGIQFIGFGLVGEIIIFTQASNLRDYKVDEEVVGTRPHGLPAEPHAVADNNHPVRVRELLPGEDSRWDAFVRATPGASFFHLSGWRRIVEDCFRHRPQYLIAEQGRQWLGVLPMFWVKSPFLGSNLISVPYGVYGGVVTERDDVRKALVRSATSLGRQLGANYIELRHAQQQCPELPCSDLYVTFCKELPSNPDDVLLAIPKKARAEVRRARDRFQLTFAESQDLDEFFALFAGNKRRLGSPSLPLRWFRAIAEEFGSLAVLHVARDTDGSALAAVMSFCFGDVLCAYYSGSAASAHDTGVNDFIYCRLMEWGASKGFRVFDFGRSRKNTGPASFKKNMGFVAQALSYEYVLLGAKSALPAFHPSNPRLRVPQRLWSRLPQFLTERIGGRLSRYLP